MWTLIASWACTGITACEVACDQGDSAACERYEQQLLNPARSPREPLPPSPWSFSETLERCEVQDDPRACRHVDLWRSTQGTQSTEV